MNHRDRHVTTGMMALLATIAGLLFVAPTTSAELSDTHRGTAEITISNDAWPKETAPQIETEGNTK